MMPFDAKNPVDKQATVDQVSPRDANIFNLAVAAIRRGLLAPLARLWSNHRPRGFAFVIYALLAFVYIKSRGYTGFPFETHPNTMRVSVTSLLMYGLATLTHNVISAARLDSVYVRIAFLARLACLYILAGSLASLFFF